MKRSIAVAAAALAGSGLLLAVGAFAFIFMGAYNVAATVPHLPVTDWLLDLTQERSVAVRAGDVPQPPPVDSARVQHAFEHFEEMCVVCHGAPGVERGELGKGINPQPPDLAEAAAEWSDRELFWIIKNGIKLAGMPAFGITHSDEELWAIVSIVRRLQDMSPDEYQRLVTDASAHGGLPRTEGHAHPGTPGMEAQDHAEMPMSGAQPHERMPNMEAEDHSEVQQTDHAHPGQDRAGAPVQPAVLEATPHQGHAGVPEGDAAAAGGREAEAERRAAEPAQVDAEATERLKSLAAELLRDSLVLRRIRADSALQRRWENENLRRELTAPLQ